MDVFIFSSPGQSPERAIVLPPGVCIGVGISKMLQFLRLSFLCDGKGDVRRAILSL